MMHKTRSYGVIAAERLVVRIGMRPSFSYWVPIFRRNHCHNIKPFPRRPKDKARRDHNTTGDVTSLEATPCGLITVPATAATGERRHGQRVLNKGGCSGL